MMNVSRPVGMPAAPYQPYGAPQAPMAPMVAAPPTAMTVPVAPQSTGGIMQVVKDIFSGIVNFFKKLFGGGGATTVPGTTPGTVPGTTPGTTPAGQVDDATLAQQFGLRNDPANVAAFREILARTTAEPGVIGPGSTNADAVKELQQVLTQFGFPCAVTGQFDAATVDAVLKFKRANNLGASYKLADGTAAVHPFIDEATKQAMIRKLSGQP